MKLFLLVIAMGLTAGLQGRQLFKEKNYRDLGWFLVFLLLSFSVAILYLMEVKLPNPSKVIETIVGFFVQTEFGYQIP